MKEHLKLMAFPVVTLVLAIICWGVIVFYHPTPVHAQSGTTCCKIDPDLLGVDDQGNFVVYHLKGPVNLPAGATNIYTGNSLSKALEVVEDDTYNTKAPSN